MSHRLEDDMDTKYADYKEPKTSRRLSASDTENPPHARTKGDVQTQDVESVWNLARESDSTSKSRGSLTDEDYSVENVKKQEKGK